MSFTENCKSVMIWNLRLCWSVNEGTRIDSFFTHVYPFFCFLSLSNFLKILMFSNYFFCLFYFVFAEFFALLNYLCTTIINNPFFHSYFHTSLISPFSMIKGRKEFFSCNSSIYFLPYLLYYWMGFVLFYYFLPLLISYFLAYWNSFLLTLCCTWFCIWFPNFPLLQFLPSLIPFNFIFYFLTYSLLILFFPSSVHISTLNFLIPTCLPWLQSFFAIPSFLPSMLLFSFLPFILPSFLPLLQYLQTVFASPTMLFLFSTVFSSCVSSIVFMYEPFNTTHYFVDDFSFRFDCSFINSRRSEIPRFLFM